MTPERLAELQRDRDSYIEIATDAVAEIRTLRKLLIWSWTPINPDQSMNLEEQVRECLGDDFPKEYEQIQECDDVSRHHAKAFTERLAEIVDKVRHGYNLINSEAREVFEHFGVAIEQWKRCRKCDGDPIVGYDYPNRCEIRCRDCNGTGYEVTR